MEKRLVRKDFWKYVSFSVMGMMCMSLFVLADTFFIAQAMGSDGIAALNFSVAIYSVIMSVGLMVGIGGATQFSILVGKGKNAASTFTHALIAGGTISLIFVLIGAIFSTQISQALGATGYVLDKTVIYVQYLLFFAPILITNAVIMAFVRNDSNPKLVMASMAIASFANIIFDWIFLFPLNMGMFGAILATGLATVLSIGVLSTHFFRKGSKLFVRKTKIHVKKIANQLLLGSSAFLGEMSWAISLIIFNGVIFGLAGNVGVAAYAVVANMAFFIVSIFIGIAQGIQPLISSGHGRGQPRVCRRTLKYAVNLILAISIVTYVLVYFNAEWISSMFNRENDPVLQKFAVYGLRIYFIGILFAGFNIIAATFLSAITSAKSGLTISTLRGTVILIPLTIILSANLGMNGVWISFVATEGAVAMLSLFFLLRKIRNMKRGINK